ncbi:SDR family oxidoreductase [Clostridium neuense]|uniref:SDR family oxidoreductase n=1 Tax=Clostridium neuense TaxID=1728934 RepID=A0ABW8T8T9_9CLOT
MKTIVVTGKDGFFASRFIDYYKEKYNIIGFSHDDLDITNEKQTVSIISKYKPDYLVHAAAISDTGACERNPEKSFEVNVKGSINVAKACVKTKAKLIYLSSDQVYGGNDEVGPYDEEKYVPNNVYGKHKIQAEKEILRVMQNVVILRLTWLFDLPERQKKTNSNIVWNIAKALMENKAVKFPANEYRGITYVHDLVKNFDKIIDLPVGVYNAGSENNLSTYEVAKTVIAAMGLSYRIEEILIKDVERYKEKNKDLRISNNKLKNHGIYFSSTEEAIRNCIKDFLF